MQYWLASMIVTWVAKTIVMHGTAGVERGSGRNKGSDETCKKKGGVRRGKGSE
jgi:hypothetical protein